MGKTNLDNAQPHRNSSGLYPEVYDVIDYVYTEADKTVMIFSQGQGSEQYVVGVVQITYTDTSKRIIHHMS